MTEMTRWNFEVSSAIDQDVRNLLMQSGGNDSELPGFVEELVAIALRRDLFDGAGVRNADLTEEEVMALVNEEIAAYRRERRASTPH